LEQTKYTLTAQVQVLQTEVNGVKERLDRIEKKLDRALDR
jgi:tetrahydromethanopterin S-methyltransferase subunit G